MDPHVIHLHDRLPAIGRYKAVSCRDAASLPRDGEEYIAMNLLSSRPSGRRECEVLFRDGAWFLADPDLDLIAAPAALPE